MKTFEKAVKFKNKTPSMEEQKQTYTLKQVK